MHASGIYNIPSESYGDAENRFLPLLYVILAIGTLFVKSQQNNNPEGASFKQGKKRIMVSLRRKLAVSSPGLRELDKLSNYHLAPRGFPICPINKICDLLYRYGLPH
jgi:hypothetical protein